jgi:hypothetical protein
MPTFNVMAWNIQNYGSTKHANYGAELVDFIARVMLRNNVSVAGICEIRNLHAATIGVDLATQLNNTVGPQWHFGYSAAFGTARWEQYLFVWNNNIITNNSFITSFPIPATNPQQYYGFPLLTKNRPPYAGDFSIGGKRMMITMYHAPNPAQHVKIRNACNTISDLTELDQHDGGILMGDFNVHHDDDVAVANSNGEYAFNLLAGLTTSPYDELLINQDTSLISYGNAGTVTTIAGAFNQPYDKFFIRTINNGVNSNAETVERILLLGSNGGPYQASMQAIQTKNAVAWVLNAAGNYALDQAFRLYRGWISDHVPIVMTVNY